MSAHLEAHHGESGHQDHHSIIGTVLVIGFVCMLLVDQLSARRHKDDATGSKITTTIGLVVHAAADGIALGAAVASAKEDITFIVFVAILLHKAPAAFGLVTFLMHDNTLDRTSIRKHLAFFSISTPISTFLTTLCLVWASSDASQNDSGYATGIALLFSAGTFLYVATVHVLPEVTTAPPTALPGNGGSHFDHGHQRSFTPSQLLCLIGGMGVPLVLGALHSH